MRGLFALLGLLTCATSALAKCAWVLWSRMHNPNPGAWVLPWAEGEMRR